MRRSTRTTTRSTFGRRAPPEFRALRHFPLALRASGIRWAKPQLHVDAKSQVRSTKLAYAARVPRRSRTRGMVHIQTDQLTIERPGTRPKSREFRVTTERQRSRATPAIRRSLEPMLSRIVFSCSKNRRFRKWHDGKQNSTRQKALNESIVSLGELPAIASPE